MIYAHICSLIPYPLAPSRLFDALSLADIWANLLAMFPCGNTLGNAQRVRVHRRYLVGLTKQGEPEGWHKSTWSDSSGGACVEVLVSSSAVRVRDSKGDGFDVLHFSPETWEEFISCLKAGEFPRY